MKKLFSLVIYAVLCFSAVTAGEIDSLTLDRLVSQIGRAQEPFSTDEHIIFTADSSARHVGIAFDFENFKKVHSFQRSVYRNEKDEVISSILFYIIPKPENTSSIKYRLVMDGLWTVDPLNNNTVYDQNTGLVVSNLHIKPLFMPKTVVSYQSGAVHFVYEGVSGETIRLAGSFNNWDSFMYEMTEVSAGLYQLDLPLPTGTYYYAFYSGTNQLPDTKNSNRVYTKDGKVASVITVK